MPGKHNYEFKAYYENLDKAINICTNIGAKRIRNHDQKDIYYSVKKGRLKLRDNNFNGKQLIYYERLNTSKARSCYYDKIDITPLAQNIATLLKNALGIKTIVQKHRITFQTEYALINIDNLSPIGNFVEIEVSVDKTKSIIKAKSIADELKHILEIQLSDIVSFSYSDLVKMHEKAKFWRSKIRKNSYSGKLFLIDGCSCSGKTTIAHRLVEESSHDIKFILRYCTRKKRENEKNENEYIFIDSDTFNEMASNGEFIEYRDFEFGMSYGLAWEDSVTPIISGNNAIGLINLGNIVHIKRIMPEAVTILINAPIETILTRLHQRGYNTKKEIEERINNAKTVALFEKYYDYVLNNDNGMLDQTLNSLKNIILRETQAKSI